ncbi:uncharacterized protein LOC110694816 [Chenopodium quinoa]|uniref:uncharacterized protein LOC110694816 n=1 Tax=Chenopodium quinoa TaxID=63459 RepID=UPI000B787645|nr:uncharacterized protein LOC110694816 [Chenopodium quinoa]
MLTAEYIAERYLEEFESNPGWGIKEIRARILNDLGIEVNYFKAWCNVVVYGINSQEPPLFMRMLICLRPLRDGFAKACRPLIGLDGCHLKGAYPRKILVAVAKDGNNNLFSLAWAIVEIENKETWSSFLESLKAMFKNDQGAGLTIMSDRQKLLFEYEIAMESIKFLDEEAYEIDFVARSCVVQPSRENTFEVLLKDNQVLVNLEKETCTCYHWELTDISCLHAYACMLDMRGDIKAYVDPYYTMDTYMAAYELVVQPMPSPKHWEKVQMREPQPPSFKVQPGRPKSKKRKLEPRQCSTAGGQPSTTKRKKQCSHCGDLDIMQRPANYLLHLIQM